MMREEPGPHDGPVAGASEPSPLVTDLLTSQHRDIMRLLAEIEDALVAGGRPVGRFDDLRRLLVAHEVAEEMVLYPVLRAVGDRERQLAARLAEQEADATSLLATLEDMGVEHPDFLFRFGALHDVLHVHTDKEEAEVFPLLRITQSTGRLVRMGRAALLAERLAPTHAHRHAPHSALGNLIVGPFAAIADHLRDSVHRKAS